MLVGHDPSMLFHLVAANRAFTASMCHMKSLLNKSEHFGAVSEDDGSYEW